MKNFLHRLVHIVCDMWSQFFCPVLHRQHVITIYFSSHIFVVCFTQLGATRNFQNSAKNETGKNVLEKMRLFALKNVGIQFCVCYICLGV